MTADKRKRLERELDQAAYRWKTASGEREQQEQKDQIFLTAFDLHEPPDAERLALDSEQYARSFALVSALDEAFKNYSSEKGQFSHYLSLLIKNRATDSFRWSERHAPSADSLDTPISEDQSLTLGDTVQAPAGGAPEEALTFNAHFAELTSMILNFSQRHTGRAGNETRRMWYRLFYTEDMTYALKACELRLLHERDIFQAMEESYLDYYMSKPCRTARQLAAAPLKPYGNVVPGRDDTEETPLPLPGDVSLCYLRRQKGLEVGNTARSNQYKFYSEEKKHIYRFGEQDIK